MGIGAVLTQEGMPLAYFCKELGPKGQAIYAYEKEMVALVKKCSSYLMDKHLMDYPVGSKVSHRGKSDRPAANSWGILIHTPFLTEGKDNIVAHALSRIPEIMQSRAKGKDYSMTPMRTW